MNHKVVRLESWIDFIKLCETGINHKSIFRGQSNIGVPFEPWSINSAFFRKSKGYTLFYKTINDYKKIIEYVGYYKLNINPNKSIPFIDFIQILQHYGVPTPLIDFTFDPLVALYFAVAELPEIFLNKHNSNSFISIYELPLGGSETNFEEYDKEEFEKYVYINTTDEELEAEDLINRYNDQMREKGFVGFFLTNPNFEINPNALRQNGAFIYFDSQANNLLQVYDGKVIEYQIPYSSMEFSSQTGCRNIFAYLMYKRKIGMFLFEKDIQGIRLDLSNGLIAYTLDCVNNISNCNCLENLKPLFADQSQER